MTRQMKTVKVFEKGWTNEWPDNLAEFIAWVTEKQQAIPVEYRGSASIEIGSESGYEGCSSVTFEISYSRPETDMEMSHRLERDGEYRRLKEDEERRTLAELQAKYGVTVQPSEARP